MPLFKSGRIVEKQIDSFFDQVAEGVMVYREGVQAYIAGDLNGFSERMNLIDKLESRADKLSREVESYLYSHSLIPEHRGDVLGLLEHTDNIIDTAKTSLMQFSIEQPEIPEELNDGFIDLAVASDKAVDAVIMSARAFFRDVGAIKDHLFKVHHYEKEADIIGAQLKRNIFNMDIDLSRKIHLRYFALNVEKISDKAEEVADRLAIYAIKRTI